MSRSFAIHPAIKAYQRTVQFAIELIDPVTLERISRGVMIVADGLRGKPVINMSGMFVWLKEDTDSLGEIRIDPGTLPYERVTVPRNRLKLPPNLQPSELPLTTIELQPRGDYVFTIGTTGIRGTLIESRIAQPAPIRNAEVSLQWLDDDGTTWNGGLSYLTTNDKGEFVAVLRLASADMPSLDADGAISIRLRAKSSGIDERYSTKVKIPLAHVSDQSTIKDLNFSWDEFQP